MCLSFYHENLVRIRTLKSGPEVVKNFHAKIQLSMNFFMLINVKMPTIIGSYEHL